MISSRLAIYANEVMARWPDLIPIAHEAEGREALIKLVDQEIEHLDELLKAHALNADAVTEKTVDRLRLDDTPQGKYIRGYKLKCTSAYYRGLEAARKSKNGTDPGRVTKDERWVPDRAWRGAGGLTREKPSDGERAEVDLSWAYESNAGGERGNETIGGTDGASPRESARIEVILDTVLSDAVTDSDDSIDTASDLVKDPLESRTPTPGWGGASPWRDSPTRRDAAATSWSRMLSYRAAAGTGTAEQTKPIFMKT